MRTAAKKDIRRKSWLLDELIDQGVAGLAICTLDDPSIQHICFELSKAGMPCITFNSDLSESGRLCFVGHYIHKSGRVAGELMSKVRVKG